MACASSPIPINPSLLLFSCDAWIDEFIFIPTTDREEIKAGWLLGVCMALPGQMASTATASTACFAWLPVHVCEPSAVAGTYKMPSRTRLELHDSLVDHVYQFITVQAHTWKARDGSIPCNKQSERVLTCTPGWFIEKCMQTWKRATDRVRTHMTSHTCTVHYSFY